jgi:uncharacterized protein
VSAALEVSLQQARRFALASQALLPHLQFRGVAGTEQAVRHMGYVQLDTINVVERSHDLTLLSRVRDYDKAYLRELLYEKRRLMEYCEPLLVVPTDEYCYFRTTFPGHDPWHGDAHQELLAPVVERVRAAVVARGPLSTRQIEGEKIVGGFGIVKDVTRAFWRLWYGGEVLTHHRDANFGRYFDLTERCIPSGTETEPVDEQAARRFFARKILGLLGVSSVADFAARLRFHHGMSRRLPAAERRTELTLLVADGEAVEVAVAGMKEPHFVLVSQLDRLRRCAKPLDGEEEANFLAPLDALLWDRARVLRLFGFDYRWEVYMRPHDRRWGYYVLPILWGANLVGRLDPKMDRKRGVLHIRGPWLENPELAREPAFTAAFERELERFAQFHGATAIERSA